MAVISTPLNSTIVIRYEAAIDQGGFPVIKQKSLNDVRYNVSEEDAHEVAKALFELGQYPVSQIILRRNFDLLED